MKSALFIAALLVAVMAAWILAYPDGDPKNWKYVFWKRGLYQIDLDTAAGTMIGDGADRKKLVIGRTKAELQEKFGYLTPPADASQYMQLCYSQSANGRDALVIRKSPWLVVFENERAVDLILCKGC